MLYRQLWTLACLASATGALAVMPRPDAPPEPLLLHGGIVVDGTGAGPRTGVSVLIEGGVITQVGPAGSFPIPRGTRAIDVTGRWITPGLWDMHVHMGKLGAEALPLFVAAGITSVRDMGGDFEELVRMRRRVGRGEIVGPRMVIAGPMFDAPETIIRLDSSATREPYHRTRVPVAAAADAARLVDSIVDLGVDFIKIRETADLDIYAAIVAAAHARRVSVAGHAPFGMDPLEGARLGLTTFEHASYPYPLDTLPAMRREQLRAFREGGTAIVPTLVAWSTYLMHPDSIALIVADSAGARDERRPLLSSFLMHEWAADLEDKEPLSPESRAAWCGFVRQTIADLRAFHEAGVPILAGTDAGSMGLVPAWSLHEELELLVAGGILSPAEALHAATGLAARYAGRDTVSGTVHPGRAADLLVLRSDPTRDIGALRAIERVVVHGRLLEKDELTSLRAGVPLSYGGGVNLFPATDAAGCPSFRP